MFDISFKTPAVCPFLMTGPESAFTPRPESGLDRYLQMPDFWTQHFHFPNSTTIRRTQSTRLTARLPKQHLNINRPTTTHPLQPPPTMDLETFTLLPLHLDPTSKSLSCPTHSSPQMTIELSELNSLHRLLLNVTDSPFGSNIPPPPIPLNPKRGAQIAKMREQGNTLMRRARRDDAEEAVKCVSPSSQPANATSTTAFAAGDSSLPCRNLN